jgi:hypothetical protein
MKTYGGVRVLLTTALVWDEWWASCSDSFIFMKATLPGPELRTVGRQPVANYYSDFAGFGELLEMWTCCVWYSRLVLILQFIALVVKKSSGSGLENRLTTVGDPPRWPRDTPLSTNLALNFVDICRSLSRYRTVCTNVNIHQLSSSRGECVYGVYFICL